MEHLSPWHRQVAASLAASTRDLGPVTAHGIKVWGPAKVSGQHLSLAPNDPALSERPQQAMGAELQQLADQIAAKNQAAPARASSVRAPQPQIYAPAISAYAGCILCGCTDHASGSCYGGSL